MSDMIPSNVTLADVEKAGTPAQKSQIRRLYETMSSGNGAFAKAKGHAIEAAHGVRAGGEAAITAAALAYAHCKLKTGLEPKVAGKRLPIDAGLAALGIGGAIALGPMEGAADLRNIGASALSVFTFRKTYDYLERKTILEGKGVLPGGTALKLEVEQERALTASKTPAHGDIGAEDPIVAAAQYL